MIERRAEGDFGRTLRQRLTIFFVVSLCLETEQDLSCSMLGPAEGGLVSPFSKSHLGLEFLLGPSTFLPFRVLQCKYRRATVVSTQQNFLRVYREHIFVVYIKWACWDMSLWFCSFTSWRLSFSSRKADRQESKNSGKRTAFHSCQCNTGHVNSWIQPCHLHPFYRTLSCFWHIADA